MAMPPPLPGGPSLVRLVLGPANGGQLMLPPGAPVEVRVRVNGQGEVSLVQAGGPADVEQHVYRRVFDRVYRWMGPARSP